jgi:hypothetical protein
MHIGRGLKHRVPEVFQIYIYIHFFWGGGTSKQVFLNIMRSVIDIQPSAVEMRLLRLFDATL